MNAIIEKENIKLGPQGTSPFVTEEKPAWRQEQQRTCVKAPGVAEQLATMKAKYITSEWYLFYQMYVHESETTAPMFLSGTYVYQWRKEKKEMKGSFKGIARVLCTETRRDTEKEGSRGTLNLVPGEPGPSACVRG